MAEKTDLSKAIERITVSRGRCKRLWEYYDGLADLVYTASKLRGIFGARIDANFQENWCAVVVDTVAGRLNLGSLESKDQDLTQMFESVRVDFDDAILALLVCGESYLIGDLNEDGTPTVYYNDPAGCMVWYNQERPREKDFGAKLIHRADKTWKLSLYYPDRFEFYETGKSLDPLNLKDTSFTQIEVIPNQWAVVPVFHLRRSGRRAKSELDPVIPIQDMINKLIMDLMVASEFASLGQRYVVSNSDMTPLKSSDNVWTIPKGDKQEEDTQVGQFATADLGGFNMAIDAQLRRLSTIAGMPKHFFESKGDPSGEALLAMEKPLVAKVEDITLHIAPECRAVGSFLTGGKVPSSEVLAKFHEPEITLPRTQAEIRGLNTGAGIPIVTSLRREGWTEDELAQMEKDRATIEIEEPKKVI